MASKSSGTQWIGAGIAIAVVIGAAVYFARGRGDAVSTLALPAAGPATNAQGATSSSASMPPAASGIEHPIDQAVVEPDPALDAPLPAIEDSDLPVFDSIAAFAGGNALGALVNPQHLVQRIVATVDGLTRPKLGDDISPVRSAQGAFATRVDGAQRVVAPDNAARYDAYVAVARTLDVKKMVSWYVHAYPLFQAAYRELGYPDGYFNDRLIVVIDHLLATPDAPAAIAVTRPKVMYEYADADLEARSAGQKMLLRIGAANEAVVKGKLREIRAALVGQSLPRE